MPVCLDVVVVLGAALYVHAAGVPVSLLRNALRAPMSPDSELGVAEPVGIAVSLQRFPIRPEGTRDRAAGKTAVGIAALLAQRAAGSRQQTGAACNELPAVKASSFVVHLQMTPWSIPFMESHRQIWFAWEFQCKSAFESSGNWGDRKSTRLNSSHLGISYA